MSHLGSALAVRYWPPDKPPSYEQVIVVNWLEVEMPRPPGVNERILQKLRGWRNREVFEYITYFAPDWTAGMYLKG